MLSLNTTFDELKLSGIRRFAAMAKETPGCISLTLGEPDADTSDEVKAEVPPDLLTIPRTTDMISFATP